MTTDSTHPDLYGHSDPRVFVTQPDAPSEGRTFVWAVTRWFERMDDDGDGGVLFPPLPYDEESLRGWLQESGEEMTEVDNEFTAIVRDEFTSQVPLYPAVERDQFSSQVPLDPEEAMELSDLTN